MDTEPGEGPAGYPRSVRSPRGEARRRVLLERVTEDLAAHGLVDFSLRRAARAAGTTHKVLLYHFDGAEDLLLQAVLQLRARRISSGLAAAGADPGKGSASLAGRVQRLWAYLQDERTGLRGLHEQAIGLAMYDPGRHGELGRQASAAYLPPLLALCPSGWTDQRKTEVAELVLAAVRGFLVDLATSRDRAGSDAGFAALLRALEREEAADDRP